MILFSNVEKLNKSMFFFKIGALTSKPFAFSARSWELENVETNDFFDSFGSQIYLCLRNNRVLRVLPRIEAKVNEEWVSDKIRFSYDGWFCQRLSEPYYLTKSNMLKKVSWKDAFFYFYFRINLSIFDWAENGYLDGVLGKFVDVETALAYRDFAHNMKQLHSRIFVNGTQNSVNCEHKMRYSFFKNFDILSKVKNLIIFGCDLRLELPLLFMKIMEKKDTFLLFFGVNLNYMTVKNRAFSLGNSFSDFVNFFNGRTLTSRLVNRVSSEETVILVGESFLERQDGNELINFFLNNKLYNKMFFLKTRFSSINLAEIGVTHSLNNLLYYKLKRVLLFLLGFDEILLKKFKYDFVVYQGSHGDEGILAADLCLPGTTLLEKKSTAITLNLKKLNYEFLMSAPGEARVDWRIVNALSLLMHCNFALNYRSLNELYVRLNQIAPSALVSFDTSSSEEKTFMYKRKVFSLANTVSFCLFGNYFNNDYFSRSSKTMGLAFQNYMVFFNNFK
jgi:NADH-quinone oxidoreductase subunit G